MPPEKLEKNILSTYFSLRMGIVVEALLLPLIVSIGLAWLGRDDLQNSISAYYGAGDGAMRNWFVAILCSVGAFLYLYKGFSDRENILLNCAGISAVIVAMRPCDCWNGGTNVIHNVSAVAFFVFMASVCWFCANETVTLLPAKDQGMYRRTYKTIGSLLLLSPATALVFSFVLQSLEQYKFFVEAFGVWTFGAYWIVKSRELSITCAEQDAAHGRLGNSHRRGLVPAPEYYAENNPPR